MIDHHPLQALNLTLHRLEQKWLPPYPDNKDSYGWESLPLDSFLAGIETAKTYLIDRDRFWGNRLFLDVGCGIGTKLLIAHFLGWRVAGVELHAPYAEIARKLVPEASIITGDAFQHADFQADLLYMYRPRISDEGEAELEAHIASFLRPGNLWFLPHRVPPYGTQLSNGVWVM